jgi:outer membrane protein assembly factor BamA
MLGLAETYKLSMRTNDRGDKDMQFNVSFPSLSSQRMPLHFCVKSFVEDKHGLSSFKTNYRSVSAGTSSSDGSHRVNLEFSARDENIGVAPTSPSLAGAVMVAGSGKLASHDVSNSIVPSTKTSLSYVFTQDSRNSVSNPTSGGYLEFQSEVRREGGAGGTMRGYPNLIVLTVTYFV